MIDSSLGLEKFLQNRRFGLVKKYLIGDVLDFGGNRGELRRFVKGNYLAVNYDHSLLTHARADTIVSLAVIEHIEVAEVYRLFQRFKEILKDGGRLFLTTPTRPAKPVLEFLARLGILDQENITEHKHYWNKKEIYHLAEACGFSVKKYKKFQLGFNQLAVFEHR